MSVKRLGETTRMKTTATIISGMKTEEGFQKRWTGQNEEPGGGYGKGWVVFQSNH